MPSHLSHNTERCHEETVQVLGYDRLPSMDDRDRLPYTLATVHEIQPCGNITPVGLVHETIQPTKLHGYDLPQIDEEQGLVVSSMLIKDFWDFPSTGRVLLLDLAFVCMTLVLGLIFMVLFEIFRIHSFKSQFPPGPTPLPFVGNLPLFLKNPMEFIRSLSQYGEMTTMYLGRKPTIMLNTIQLAKEVLVQDAFAGRPCLPVLDWVSNGLGIVMVTFNNSWRQQRRFALHTLRNFGLGKKSIESRVLEESQYLIAELLKDEGKSVNPHHALQNAFSNVICSIVFGDRFDYDNKRFEHFLKILGKSMILTGSAAGQIFNLAPFIKHFPGPHQKIKQNANELFGFIRDEVKEHKKTLDPGSPRDFIDAYLLEIEKHKSNKDSTFHEDNLIGSAIDLFFAGTDTTETTIRWGLLFLIQNPDVQERCHEEIVQVLGYDRLPSMDDRDRLPYTHATVHEIQRCAKTVPLGVIHETIQPTKLRGFDIPQETMILINLAAIFSNKEHWKHPDTFNPENFLDENGHFSKPECFIPFSLGLRVCLGEMLVRTELFLFITSLLQRIHFSWPPEAKPTDMDGIMGIVRYPQTFSIICCSRDTKE
ncbi:LOW QUALITY PROTEIN: cytochrome P450 2B12-like [Danio aesculapii]|uniref:LOW QUALITY PROTEIN: cytochrome P450 2B12-like n=1 Tax=Danio aesculapii TaxID=1142201 RepID=UPI0024C0A4F0|nr:LOW QUALITY PROTEIN: cytochrome P450 2B12-like [Danio aesculapii]